MLNSVGYIRRYKDYHTCKGGKDDDYDTKDAAIVAQEENTTGLLEIESQISQEHFINLTFEAPTTYRTGVPFAGKVS